MKLTTKLKIVLALLLTLDIAGIAYLFMNGATVLAIALIFVTVLALTMDDKE